MIGMIPTFRFSRPGTHIFPILAGGKICLIYLYRTDGQTEVLKKIYPLFHYDQAVEVYDRSLEVPEVWRPRNPENLGKCREIRKKFAPGSMSWKCHNVTMSELFFKLESTRIDSNPFQKFPTFFQVFLQSGQRAKTVCFQLKYHFGSIRITFIGS